MLGPRLTDAGFELGCQEGPDEVGSYLLPYDQPLDTNRGAPPGEWSWPLQLRQMPGAGKY